MGEIVFQQNKEVLTSSLIVAEAFGKQHKTVLRSIAKLNESLGVLNRTAQKCALLQEESNDLFYRQLMKGVDLSNIQYHKSSYIGEQNKEHDMYLMNKDSFILLAMGFNGVKALRFKLAFIGAFNKMQKELAVQHSDTVEALKEQLAITEMNADLGGSRLDAKISKTSGKMVTTEEIAWNYGIQEEHLYEALSVILIVHQLGGVWYIHEHHKLGSMARETYRDQFGVKRDRLYILWSPDRKHHIAAIAESVYHIVEQLKDHKSCKLVDIAEQEYNEYNRNNPSRIKIGIKQFKDICHLLSHKIN